MAKVTHQETITGAAGTATATIPLPEQIGKSKPLPPIPDKNCPIDWALDYWAKTDAVHPNRLIGYLYRIWPIIKKGGTSNIAVYPEPVTYKTILNQWGAGKYKLHVNDKDRSKFGELTISRWETKEDYADCPPVLDERADLDWGHKDNQAYCQWLKSRGTNMAPQGNGTNDTAVQGLVSTLNVLLAEIRKPAQPGSDTAAFSRLAEMFAVGHKASMDMALSQVKQNSPEDTIKLLTMMQSAFGTKDAGRGSDAMTTYLLQELKASREQQTTLMNRILDFQTKPAKEDSRTHRMMDRMMDMAFDSLTHGGNAKISIPSKWAWLEAFRPEIGELVTSIGMFARQTKGTGSFPRSAPNPQTPSTVAPAAAGLPGPSAPEPQEQTAANQENETMHELAQFLMQTWTPLCKFIKEGRSAIDFADYLVEGFGFTVTDHDKIKAFGRDKLLAMVQQQGATALRIQDITMDRFARFLDEFLTWEPGTPPDDGGPAEPEKAKVM